MATPLRSFYCALLGAAAALSIVVSVQAADKAVSVADAFSFPTAEGSKTGAAFMAINNNGAAADRLIGATSPLADHVEIHTMTQNEQGVMQMRQIPELAVEAGQSVSLAPKGLHLMLMGLKQQLQTGTTIPLTLHFEKAGDIAVQVAVKSLAEKEAAINTAPVAPVTTGEAVPATEAPATEAAATEAAAPEADPHAAH